MNYERLKLFDPQVYELVKLEEARQENTLDMIPSENYTHPAVREALASVFVHKYAEGQINARYYEGNQNIDDLDILCKDRIKQAFRLPADWTSNIQALSGCNANLGVYNALLDTGDTILSMYLPDGGHLSHGWSFAEKGETVSKHQDEDVYLGGSRKTSIVSKIYRVIQYKTNRESRIFDYERIRETAHRYRPKLIVTGGTAYPREIDHEKIGRIAEETKAYYLADVSHEAGLIAAEINRSPVGIADVVTFTTQKTLRGPRGAVILCKEELAEKIDLGIFPGLQGGPHEHTIAAIAVCLKDVMSGSFREYARQTICNAKHLAKSLGDMGYDIVSGGTDKHLVLIDLRNMKIPGRHAAYALNLAGIVINKNTVPNETGNSINPSGIRLGTPALTTRGMKEYEIGAIAGFIHRVLCSIKPYSGLALKDFKKAISENHEIKAVNEEVKKLCERFPLDRFPSE